MKDRSLRYPFGFIHPVWWPPLFWSMLGLTILLMVVFGISGAPLTTDAAPCGIVSFELAGTAEQMLDILSSWDANAQIRAAFSLGLDYLFMASYASTLVLGCGMAAALLARQRWPLNLLGNWLAWAMILAALLDVVENMALVIILFGTVASPWPEIARWCAIPKFVLIFIGIVYVIYGGVVALVEHISPKEPE